MKKRLVGDWFCKAREGSNTGLTSGTVVTLINPAFSFTSCDGQNGGVASGLSFTINPAAKGPSTMSWMPSLASAGTSIMDTTPLIFQNYQHKPVSVHLAYSCYMWLSLVIVAPNFLPFIYFDCYGVPGLILLILLKCDLNYRYLFLLFFFLLHFFRVYS